MPILLAIYIQSVYPKIVIKNLYATPPSLFVPSHLRDIAFTSVPSVPPCAYYIRVLVYHSIFRKNRINLLLSFFFLSFCLFYYSVFICLFVILSLFVLLSSSVLLYCKDNSNLENQKGINCLSINALLVCKRCPLSPLLTPFWAPIKHLFSIAFVNN